MHCSLRLVPSLRVIPDVIKLFDQGIRSSLLTVSQPKPSSHILAFLLSSLSPLAFNLSAMSFEL